MSRSLVHWRAVPREALAWWEWGDEFVFRNELTGATHLLPASSARILLALVESDSGSTVHDLVLGLGNGAAWRNQSECTEAVEAALAEFEQQGLAERQGS